jgi:glycosyltransferase involved in cell wall biosynthesis
LGACGVAVLRRRLAKDREPDVSATLVRRVGETAGARGGGQDEDPAGTASILSSATSARTTPTISVVIPALNEAANLPYVIPRIDDSVDEVLLVDGYSTDQTIATARRLRSDIRVIEQEGHGKGAALRTGFAAANGDIIVMLDADGSTDPAEIPVFVGALRAGADFVKGSRFLQGGGTSDMPWYRRLGNGGFVALVRLLFAGRYSDLCYGYNAFWAEVLPTLDLDADGFEIETVMNIRALKAGLNVAEVPSFEHKRRYGSSGLKTIRDGWRVLKAIFKERFSRFPAHAEKLPARVSTRKAT